LITDIEEAIAGRRTRFGTCEQFSNKDNYVAKLKGYLQQKGVDEQYRTEPYYTYYLYGETLASLLSETYFLVNTLTAVQLHGAARYLTERLEARLTTMKVQLLKLTSEVQGHFKKDVKRVGNNFSKKVETLASFADVCYDAHGCLKAIVAEHRKSPTR
jgi:hypothetical protein